MTDSVRNAKRQLRLQEVDLGSDEPRPITDSVARALYEKKLERMIPRILIALVGVAVPALAAALPLSLGGGPVCDLVPECEPVVSLWSAVWRVLAAGVLAVVGGFIAILLILGEVVDIDPPTDLTGGRIG